MVATQICGSISNHMRNPRQNPLHRHSVEAKTSVHTFFSNKAVNFKATSLGITTLELKDLLLQTSVACYWSFDQFDNKIFRSLINRGFPGHICPGRNGMKQLLRRAADMARTEIKDQFANYDSQISLALDCWTSPNHWEFMGTSPL